MLFLHSQIQRIAVIVKVFPLPSSIAVRRLTHVQQ